MIRIIAQKMGALS